MIRDQLIETSLGDVRAQAMQDVRYIRTVMERAIRFNAVPGIGLMVMGGTALLTGVLSRSLDPRGWTIAWVTDAVVAFATGLFTMWVKARSVGMRLRSKPGQSFVFSFAPPIAVGGLLTMVFAAGGSTTLLPGIWLSLYGLAAFTAGAFSVRLVTLMGAVFLLLGAVALVWPVSGQVALVAGFGAAHVGFGLAIARRHGG